MNIKDELEKKNEEFKGKDSILGKNILSLANRMNSSRANMESNQLDQMVPLVNVEKPYVYTDYEDAVGKYSSAYYKAENDFKVINKIIKFPGSPNSIYILVLYNINEDLYDVIVKEPGERLTETYGYKFETEKMDNLKVNDEIKKGDVLYHSTSFDDDLLYGYGVNGLTLYTCDPMTVEDAMVISKSFGKKLESVEYDDVRIMVNENDILINYYGNKDVYKAFPDIGESVKDSTIAIRRRISYDQALFELKEENIRKRLNTDTPFFVPFADDKVVDINVFCNKPIEEFKCAPYNSQIYNYYKNSLDYYKQIYDVLKPIVENKSCNYTDDLSFVYSRAKKILNNDIKWTDKKNKIKIFENLIIEFKIEKHVGVAEGLKLTGRYGNKATISEIRDDEDMPMINGRHADVISNLLGVGNRLNISQLFECEINFLSNEISRLMKETDDKVLQEYYLFTYLKTIVKTNYGERVEKWYRQLDEENQREFLDSCMYDHIYVEEPPLYNNTSLDDIDEVYEKFNLKPATCKVKKFGKMRKMPSKVVMGEVYFIKLKHHLYILVVYKAS